MKPGRTRAALVIQRAWTLRIKWQADAHSVFQAKRRQSVRTKRTVDANQVTNSAAGAGAEEATEAMAALEAEVAQLRLMHETERAKSAEMHADVKLVLKALKGATPVLDA